MYNPYSRGRWYRAFIEADGTSYTLTSCDITDAVINGSRVKLPDGFHIVDIKYDIHSTIGTGGALAHATYIYADGTQAINLPGKDQFDYAYIYIFGYID